MNNVQSGLLGIVIFVLVGSPQLKADAIAYSISGGRAGQNYAIIPDLTQRSKVAFSSVSGSPYVSFTQYSGLSQTFDTTYTFQIRYYPTGAPSYYDVSTDPGLAAIDISAHVSGFLDFRNGPAVSRNYEVEGGFTASISSVLIDSQAVAADIPAPLLDLLKHPERIHLSSPDSSGSYGFIPAVYLEIDAASPVPEPATIAVFGIAFGGLMLAHRFKRRV